MAGRASSGSYADDAPDAASTTRTRELACAATQWFPGYADYFALGMAVAVIASWRLVRGEEPRWLQRIGAAPDLLWAVALVLFVGYSTLLGTHGLAYVPPDRSELRHFLNALIVLFLLLPGVFGDQSRGGVRALPALATDRVHGPRVVRRVPLAPGLHRQGDDRGPTARRCTRTSC